MKLKIDIFFEIMILTSLRPDYFLILEIVFGQYC